MRHHFAKVLGSALLSLVACSLYAHPAQKEPSQASLLPQIVQSKSGNYTIPPQVMTYAELAQLLSTPTRQVEAHPSLRQRGILVALNDRSWGEIRELLEYGLEVQFVKLEGTEGVENWQIIRHPEAEKRDNRLFDRYVQIVHKQIIDQVRQFDSWLMRSRSEIKEEGLAEQTNRLPFFPLLLIFSSERLAKRTNPLAFLPLLLSSESSSSDREVSYLEYSIPAEEYHETVRWFSWLWTQSLNGYVMLPWMRSNWTEAHTRRLIRERLVMVQQPLAQGLPGIITEKDLLDFLDDVDEEELQAYDWVIGVASWNPELRLVVPYCDIVAPHSEGTKRMAFPVILRAEPVAQGELWRQLGSEAQAYRDELMARQKSLMEEPSLNKPFRTEGARSLSELLESWAKTHRREVLMELAPEREHLWFVNTADLTLKELVQPELTRWVSEDAKLPNSPIMVLVSYYLATNATDKTYKELLYEGLENAIPEWYYELYQDVLIVHNPMAFLDRQYTYPLDALFAFERAYPRAEDNLTYPKAKDDLDLILEHLGALAWGMIRQPEHAPALMGYRQGRWLGEDFKALPALAAFASLPRSERQALLKRLEQKQSVEIPLQRLGIERLDALIRFWRRNAPYTPEMNPSLEPFGFRSAWHPRFEASVRRGSILIEKQEEESALYLFFSLQIDAPASDGTIRTETRPLGSLYFPRAGAENEE